TDGWQSLAQQGADEIGKWGEQGVALIDEAKSRLTSLEEALGEAAAAVAAKVDAVQNAVVAKVDEARSAVGAQVNAWAEEVDQARSQVMSVVAEAQALHDAGAAFVEQAQALVPQALE